MPADATEAQERGRMQGVDAWHLALGWTYGFGYTEAVFPSGRLYEGRGVRRQGAHTQGLNAEYAFMIPGHGDRTPMTDAAIATMQARIRTLIATGDLAPSYTVTGHRDHADKSCPGNLIYPQIGQLRGLTVGAPPDRIAVVRGRRFKLRHRLEGGPADRAFTYGRAGDIHLAGDWNGNGTSGIGVFRNGRWLLRDTATPGPATIDFWFGRPGDIPIVGDWTGEGRALPGVIRGDRWLLKGDLSGGDADVSFHFGQPGDRPVIGDWTGAGVDLPGVVRDGRWLLRHRHAGGPADRTFWYGTRDDNPLVGRWDGANVGIGVRRGSRWLLKLDPGGGPADLEFSYGRPSDIPLVGAWLAG